MKKFKKYTVKTAAVGAVLVMGIFMVAYANIDARLLGKRVAEKMPYNTRVIKTIADISERSKEKMEKVVNKVLQAEAEDEVSLSEEALKNIEKSVREVYYKNHEKNKAEADERGITEEELIAEQIEKREKMLLEAEYVSQTIMKIIDGEVTIDNEHIMELAGKIKNGEDKDGSLMYELYNSYKSYRYNTCDEAVVSEVESEMKMKSE